jgi:hypothetical protein
MPHKNKNTTQIISSSDEAVELIEGVVHGWEDDPVFEITEMNMANLRALVRKIWEDAYQSGWSDARYDASIEAAEAEWFNS